MGERRRKTIVQHSVEAQGQRDALRGLSTNEVREALPGANGLETSDGLVQAMERFATEMQPTVA
jgi:hypothetical protein